MYKNVRFIDRILKRILDSEIRKSLEHPYILIFESIVK
ncbi:hypothetical protein LEP1GSC052_2265 [Leptospira kmetyi serovar Malaysia str. Bejo-Iso9]|nr:hypothetical protein LEP1GSC052_2265 [Leptospira kmetyi serovar Malaysia str. Bejo-Iso9]